MAALVVDASEELREREESNLEQLLAGSRILVGAVSHEIRNVCSAIAVIHENLVRGGSLRGNKDFEALGALVETLHKTADLELKQTTSHSQIGSIELGEILDELRIVLEPYCEEAGIQVTWNVPHEMPPVWCDRHRLLQILLNLTKNSERALEHAGEKRIDISAAVNGRTVSIRVSDSGPGIASSETLFQPFQKGAESTGLGLYLSRAFARSFRGELRHDPAVRGCSFVLDLAIAGPVETVSHEADTTVIAR
jgi:two-component system sensor kinase FixL